MQHQMTFEEEVALLNPSVRPEDEIRLSLQQRKIVKRLLEGEPPTNHDLIKIGQNHTARISEIRAILEKLGFGLQGRDIGDGVWSYEIVDETGQRVTGSWLIKLLQERMKKSHAWD